MSRPSRPRSGRGGPLRQPRTPHRGGDPGADGGRPRRPRPPDRAGGRDDGGPDRGLIPSPRSPEDRTPPRSAGSPSARRRNPLPPATPAAPARRRGAAPNGTARNGTAAPAPGRRGTARSSRPAPRPVPPGPYRRRRLAAASLAGLVLVVGLGLGARVLVYEAGLADVEGVEVTGTLGVPTADVLAAAAVAPGRPLAAVDTDAVAARVTGLPGVAGAVVGRDWPHTVTIAVTERFPVAVAGGVLVDRAGVPYAPAPPGLNLPQLTFGPVGPADPATAAALGVLGALSVGLGAEVEAVDVSRTGQVTLDLAGDREVRWGSAERSAEKARVLEPLLTLPGRVYDVASPDLPTVRH
jgi:cell division protein FtsQ